MTEQLKTPQEAPTEHPDAVEWLGGMTVGEFPTNWEEHQAPESVLMYAVD